MTVAFALLMMLSAPAAAETLYLSTPGTPELYPEARASVGYALDTQTGTTTFYRESLAAGTFYDWSIPAQLRIVPGGSLICSGGSISVYCIDAATKQNKATIPIPSESGLP